MKLRHTLAAGAAALCLSLSASAAEFITVLTGGTSGVYYPLGVALTKLYVDAIPGVRTSVQATNAADVPEAVRHAADASRFRTILIENFVLDIPSPKATRPHTWSSLHQMIDQLSPGV